MGLNAGKHTPDYCNKECRYYDSDVERGLLKEWCKELCPNKPSITEMQSKMILNMIASYHYRMLGGEQLKLSRPLHFATGMYREIKIMQTIGGLFGMGKAK